jgi:hypothetical protein
MYQNLILYIYSPNLNLNIMKCFKRVTYLALLTIAIIAQFQCASSKPKLQDSAAFQTDRIYFQEWFAGINVGGTGMNMYFPNLNSSNNVVIDSVYFRNLKGKLTPGRATYTAILKNKSPYDTTTTKVRIPFKLSDNECVISYFENGEKKYLKIGNISEKEGIYYEDGPPMTLSSSE